MNKINNYEITTVLPLNDNDNYNFDEFDCITTGNEVQIVDENDLSINKSKPVIELVNKQNSIKFFINSDRQYLIIHIKTMNKYFSLSLHLKDINNNDRIINLSNKSTIVSIDKNIANIPINILERGWQRIFLDLNDILLNAFGIEYKYCDNIIIYGTCRISKIYLQSIPYSDAELPPFLRVADSSTD